MRYESLGVGVLTVDKIIGAGALAEMGNGDRWYGDVTNGSNGNSGKTPGTALKTMAAAESTMVKEQNDHLMLAPGAYPITTELDWDKDNTHIFGMDGPNQGNDYSEAGVAIYTVTTQVPYTLDVTGNHCRFFGINFTNAGNHAENLAAVHNDGYGNTYKGCSFQGIMAANQRTEEACASLYIGQNGSFYRFEDCQIGENLWGTRTQENQGHLRYVGSAPRPQNGKFIDCFFLSQSDTSTVPMVALPSTACIDRVHFFIRCHFHNFSANWGTTCARVFYNQAVMVTNSIYLIDCSNAGYTAWQDRDTETMYRSNMPNPHVDGGICKEPTGVFSS